MHAIPCGLCPCKISMAPCPASSQQGASHLSVLPHGNLKMGKNVSEFAQMSFSQICFLEITVSAELKQLDTAITINPLIPQTKACASDTIGTAWLGVQAEGPMGHGARGRGQPGSCGNHSARPGSCPPRTASSFVWTWTRLPHSLSRDSWLWHRALWTGLHALPRFLQ